MRFEEINGLKAPKQYIEASIEEKEKILNKCGPDGVINHLVPDHLIGLDISASCNIHDWMFTKAMSQSDHKKSDAVFLQNLKTQIREKKSNPLLKYLRYGFAYIYFGAVRIYSTLTKNTSQSDEKRSYKL